MQSHRNSWPSHFALAKDAKTLHLTSLASRMADSGHIKNDEALTRSKSAVCESINYGEARRAGLRHGSRRWLVSRRCQYISPYTNRKEPEPKASLIREIRKHCLAGVEEAQKYADEFGLAFLQKPFPLSELG